MSPLILQESENSIKEALYFLKQGALICFPTETVYALAADPRNDSAVARIYQCKQRESRQAVSLLCAGTDIIAPSIRLSASAQKLAARFFPGPLTLVVPLIQQAPFSPLLNQGRDSIGIRIPDYPFALALLEAFGFPLAATSANISGQPSATTAEMIQQKLGDNVALIIDGGLSPIGIGSTVIDATKEEIIILREGAISRAEIDNSLSA